jgi:hypothetical protein
VQFTDPQTEMTLVHDRIRSIGIRDDFPAIHLSWEGLCRAEICVSSVHSVLPGSTSW